VRTTVTIDADVENMIRTAMREWGVSFKVALNDAIRSGLTHHKPARRKFVQKSFAMGSEQNFRWDKALATADAIEDEELTRKLLMRK
jgi:hypothetical protein